MRIFQLGLVSNGALMRKQALGVSDSSGEYDRFDPLYYDAGFKHKDPVAVLAAVRRFMDVAKANGMVARFHGGEKHQDMAAEYLMGRLAEAAAKNQELGYLEDSEDDYYPYYYSLQYPKSLRRALRLSKEPVTLPGGHPLDAAFTPVKQAGVVGEAAKAVSEYAGVPEQIRPALDRLDESGRRKKIDEWSRLGPGLVQNGKGLWRPVA